MTSELMNNTTKAIIVIVAILIVVGGLIYIFAGTILPWMNDKFIKLDPTEQTISEDNFQKLMENIDSCIASTKTNCLCEGLPKYPGTFSSKSKLYLTIGGSQTNLSLRAGSITISQQMKNVAILTTLLVKSQQTQNFDLNAMVNQYDNLREKWIDYSKEPPIFGNKNVKSGPTLISGKLYKKANDRILYFIFAEKSGEVNLNTLNLPSC